MRTHHHGSDENYQADDDRKQLLDALNESKSHLSTPNAQLNPLKVVQPSVHLEYRQQVQHIISMWPGPHVVPRSQHRQLHSFTREALILKDKALCRPANRLGKTVGSKAAKMIALNFDGMVEKLRKARPNRSRRTCTFVHES